jgi:hypothetical protein
MRSENTFDNAVHPQEALKVLLSGCTLSHLTGFPWDIYPCLFRCQEDKTVIYTIGSFSCRLPRFGRLNFNVELRQFRAKRGGRTQPGPARRPCPSCASERESARLRSQPPAGVVEGVGGPQRRAAGRAPRRALHALSSRRFVPERLGLDERRIYHCVAEECARSVPSQDFPDFPVR